MTDQNLSRECARLRARVVDLEAGMEKILATLKGEQDMCWNIAADLLGKPRPQVAYITIPKR